MDNNNNNKKNAHHQNRDGLLLRSTTTTHHHQSEIKSPATTSSDFVLQWGNRKRLRCMKVQVKDNGTGTSTGNESASNAPVHRTTVRIDRRVVRSDHNHNIKDTSTSAKPATTAVASTVNNGNGYLNLRQRPASPAHRILRYFFDFFIFWIIWARGVYVFLFWGGRWVSFWCWGWLGHVSCAWVKLEVFVEVIVEHDRGENMCKMLENIFKLVVLSFWVNLIFFINKLSWLDLFVLVVWLLMQLLLLKKKKKKI